MVCQKLTIRDDFESAFPQWAKAVVYYCNKTQLKSTALQEETTYLSLEISDGEFQRCNYINFYSHAVGGSMKSCSDFLKKFFIDIIALMGLRCLSLLFAPIKTKKLGEDILKVVPVS